MSNAKINAGTPVSSTEQPSLRIVDRFYQARCTTAVSLEEFVLSVPQLSDLEIAELIRVDQRVHWESGNYVPAEAYFARFPQVLADTESALDVVYSEVLLREHSCEAATLDDYCHRFPHFADRLRLQWSCYQAFRAPSDSGKIKLSRSTCSSTGLWPEIPEFELLEEIGRGGMGVIYKARQISLNRIVALKMISLAVHSPEAVARFHEEAEIVAGLQHPHIVQVFDVAEYDGRPYISMEFVDGGNLSEWLSRHQPTPRAAAQLTATVASTIEWAHQRGTIHRDLKPANILISKSGEIKITDFGLAIQRNDIETWTRTGGVVGTPSYMSPEQAAGKVRHNAPSVDVYSIGAVFYELITGRPPFQGDTVLEILHSAWATEPIPPRQLRPDLPFDLETICLKCLQKDPDQRYPSAQALADDLNRFLAGRSIVARRTRLAERVCRWCRRNRLSATLAACFIGSLVFAAVGGLVAAGIYRKQHHVAEINATRAQVAEHQAKINLYDACLEQVHALRLSGEIGQRFKSLEALRRAIGIASQLGILEDQSLRLRNEAIACFGLTDLQSQHQWDTHVTWKQNRVGQITVDADLSRAAIISEDDTLHVISLSDSREIGSLTLSNAPILDATARLSSDGSWLAVVLHYSDRAPECKLWQLLDDGTIEWRSTVAGGDVCHFTHDGKHLAVGGRDQPLHLLDLVAGTPASVGNLCDVAVIAFDPSGARIACVHFADLSAVCIYDAREASEVSMKLDHPDDIKSLAWSPDGTLLAAGCDDRNGYVWDTTSARHQAILRGHQHWILRLEFNKSGDLLASTALDGTTSLWDPISGRREVVAAGRFVRFCETTGNGLAFEQENGIGLWSVAHNDAYRELHHGRIGNNHDWMRFKGPEMLACSPDGRLLASAAGDGVRIWDIATGRDIAFLNVGHHEALRFSADGRELTTFGRTGIRSWPVKYSEEDSSQLVIGPPHLRAPARGQGWFRGCYVSPSTLVAAEHVADDLDRIVLLTPDHSTVLYEGPGLATLTTSPNGEWIAAGFFQGEPGIRVWSSTSCQELKYLANDRVMTSFSPDNRWLIGGGNDDYQFWSIGDWRPGQQLRRDGYQQWACPLTFRGDGRLVALASTMRQLKLVSFPDGHELVRFEAKGTPMLFWPQFSPDGQSLFVGTDTHLVAAWDLPSIRRNLIELGLLDSTLDSRWLESVSPSRHRLDPVRHARVHNPRVEAEHLPVFTIADAECEVQDMLLWDRSRWSNGKQLRCQLCDENAVDVICETPVAGNYEITLQISPSPESGPVEVSIDGTNLGTIDVPTGPLDGSSDYIMGTTHLRAGFHRLRFRLPTTSSIGVDAQELWLDTVAFNPESEE